MKNLVLAFMAMLMLNGLSSIAQESEIVGYDRNGEYILSFDSEAVLEKVNKETDFAFKMTKMSIKKKEDIETNEIYYMLLIQNEDNTAKIAFNIERSKDNFIISSQSNSVTCTGCSHGCNPTFKASKWWCLPNCNPCSKSITIETSIFVRFISEFN